MVNYEMSYFISQHVYRCHQTFVMDLDVWTYGFNPVIPAKSELITINKTILIFVKDSKHLLELIVGYNIDVSFIISEQSATYQCELGH